MADAERMVSEVRAILAAFDWEQDDRQLALEAIERIVMDGGEAQDDEPEPADYDPGPEVDDEGGMSEHRYHEPEPWQ